MRRGDETLFAGECYYAVGGLHDFVCDFETEVEASERGNVLTADDARLDWWHVLDFTTGAIVAHGEVRPYGAKEAKPSLERK